MIPRESTLSKSEVESPIESLDVDFLIALEIYNYALSAKLNTCASGVFMPEP